MTFVLSLLPLSPFSQELSPPSSKMITTPRWRQLLHERGILICRVSLGCGGAAARMTLARAGAGAVVVVVGAPRSRSRASIGSNCPVSLWVWSCGVTGSLVPQ